MSLRIRRGTDAERLTVVFEQAEPIFTTDTEKLYMGDGVTLGGVPVSSPPSSYVHNQAIASSTWTITHNLGYKPGGIMVFDSADTQWFGTVVHIDDNSLTIDFNGSVFGGKAYLS